MFTYFTLKSVVCQDGKCMYSCAEEPDNDIADILANEPISNEDGDLVFCADEPLKDPERYDSSDRKKYSVKAFSP